MTELKTLKDLYLGAIGINLKEAIRKELKQEAIKWIKYYRERSKRHDLPVFERPICKRVGRGNLKKTR